MSFELSSKCLKAVTGITKIDREAVPSRRDELANALGLQLSRYSFSVQITDPTLPIS